MFVPVLNIQRAGHVANRTFTDALPGGFDTTSVLPRCRVEKHGRTTVKKTEAHRRPLENLGGDWMNRFSIPFRADQSVFILPV